jgi:predicted dehydrogenase
MSTRPRWRDETKRLAPALTVAAIAIAAPGESHAEIIEAALAHSAHLYVDKPFAPTAPEARRLWRGVQAAGVRSAYAATSHYQASALLARDRSCGVTTGVAQPDPARLTSLG